MKLFNVSVLWPKVTGHWLSVLIGGQQPLTQVSKVWLATNQWKKCFYLRQIPLATIKIICLKSNSRDVKASDLRNSMWTDTKVCLSHQKNSLIRPRSDVKRVFRLWLGVFATSPAECSSRRQLLVWRPLIGLGVKNL